MTTDDLDSSRVSHADPLGNIVAVFADVHGSTRTLAHALDRCAEEGVETVALLGDLFDRHEQADACAETLAGWHVVGVYGNHEREVALAAALGEIALELETVRLLSGLKEEVIVDDVRLTHEVERWGHVDPIARMFSRSHHTNGHHDKEEARLTFTGHTHVRQARDDRGALDIGRGTVQIDPARRYLINPGALQIGQYVIWDRTERIVRFRNVEW